jgi:hypothetical protein
MAFVKGVLAGIATSFLGAILLVFSFMMLADVRRSGCCGSPSSYMRTANIHRSVRWVVNWKSMFFRN